MARRPWHTATVYQLTPTECGAASLAMVLAHFGRQTPLNELCTACGVSRDGASAVGIKQGAIAQGLDFEMHQTSPERAAELPMPFIAYWDKRHFLVVEHYDQHGWHINDPAAGASVISDAEWYQHYSNYAIVLKPGSDFSPSEQRRWGYLRKLLRPLQGQWAAFLLIMVVGLLLIVPSLLLPALAAIFLDQVLVQHNSSVVVPIVAGVVAVAGFALVMRTLDQYLMIRLGLPLTSSLRAGVLWRLIRLPVDYFDHRPIGGLISRVERTDTITHFALRSVPKVILGGGSMLVLFLALVWLSPLLASIALATAVATVASLLFVSRARRSAAEQLQAGTFLLSGQAMTCFRNLESIKTLGAGRQFLNEFMDTQAQLLTTGQSLARLTAYFRTVPGAISMLSSVALLLVGALEVMNQSLSVGAVVACFMLTHRFLKPVPGFVSIGMQAQTTHAAVDQLDDILLTPPDPVFDTSAQLAPEVHPAPLRGEVQVRDLGYRYAPGAPEILRGINMDIAAGTSIGIVGPSGSGKSTLALLLAGLLQPTSGQITFDGLLRQQLPRSVLVTNIGFVSQRSQIFDGSFADNISCWDPSIPADRLTRALHDAAAMDFVARKGGLAAMVQADGKNLSGGQAQRLMLARALARSPRVLILDEATSALDLRTERYIAHRLQQLGCTRIVIAHRGATIRHCDVIYVLVKGQIVEQGNHEQLLASHGTYAKLFRRSA